MLVALFALLALALALAHGHKARLPDEQCGPDETLCPNYGCCPEPWSFCCADDGCAFTEPDCPFKKAPLVKVAKRNRQCDGEDGGTLCPGGCCPEHNWFCCAYNMYCAATEADCPIIAADYLSKLTKLL
jgi:hypothetical protein